MVDKPLDGAISPPDPPPQTDVTEWLVNELNNQVDQVILPQPSSTGVDYSQSAQEVGSLLGTHFKLFGNHQRYDIKRTMKEEIGSSVVLCGGNQNCNWVDYSAPGNVMYGYLSAARGVPQSVSWVAGGLLETVDWLSGGRKTGAEFTGDLKSWMDNPGDKAAVDFGYSLYEEHSGGGLTVSEFESALTSDILDSFQSPQAVPPYPAGPQENKYPAGYFLNP